MENVNTKEKAKSTLWDKITTILLIILVGFTVYFVAGNIHQNKTGEMFFVCGYKPVRALSGSMEPTLPVGDAALVKRTDDIEENDIIMFVSDEGSLVVHRCIDINEDGTFVTKGDANEFADFDPISQKQVIGKVVSIIPLPDFIPLP